MKKWELWFYCFIYVGIIVLWSIENDWNGLRFIAQFIICAFIYFPILYFVRGPLEKKVDKGEF